MAALLFLLLSCVACADHHMAVEEPAPTTPSAVRDETIELRVGATAPVPGTTASVTFVRVTNDSRCPKGVTCVWAGDAVVELRVQPRGGDPRTVALHTNDRFEHEATVEGVTMALERLDPYPEADRQLAADAYVATLRVGSR